MPTHGPTPQERFSEKLAQYVDATAAREWLDRNWTRVHELLGNASLRDFVFEPIKGVFDVHGKDAHSEIRAAITAVAVANAVMAGLPGKMGVGVLISMALEGWMAWVIAQRVGVAIEKPSDVWKYFGLLVGTLTTIVLLFKELLSVAFSAFSVIPGLNPLIFAELVVTNLVGVLFWVGFQEAASKGSFRVPLRMAASVAAETKGLYQHQAAILRQGLSPQNLQMMWHRLKAWLTGDILATTPELRGELFATAAMACLLSKDTASFEGPLGREFIGAIRDRYPDLGDASLSQIAEHMSQYDPDQMAGVVNMVKGKLFERLVALTENTDGDEWRAALHTDESFPGSDLVFMDETTGDSIEVSLKATDSPSYIEHALLRYPDIPILTTEEVSAHFSGHPLLTGTSISNAELSDVTESNFEELLEKAAAPSVSGIAATGVAANAVAKLWPFLAAYLRGRISYQRLTEAFERVLGESGVSLAARVSYGVILGPLFAWYLLARGAISLTHAASAAADAPARQKRRLVWQPRYPLATA